MRKTIASVQAGLEGLRWLRDEAEINGHFTDLLKNRNISEVALLAIRDVAKAMPRIDVRAMMPYLLEEGHDYVGMGAEAIVVREGAEVHKYLTGKSQKPEILAPRLRQLQIKAEGYLGEYLAPTDLDIVHVKLFKGLPAKDSVRLTQPFVDIEYVDPHLDPKLLASKPEIARSLSDFSERLVGLFEQEGLLMDVVNQGNLTWGCHEASQPNQLSLIDTLPVNFASKDFTGVRVPFWSPKMHLEYLVDFVNTTNPTLLAKRYANFNFANFSA